MPLNKPTPGPRDSVYRAIAFENLYHHLTDAGISDLLQSPTLYPDGPDEPTIWRRHHGWLNDMIVDSQPTERRRDRVVREIKDKGRDAYSEVMGELLALRQYAGHDDKRRDEAMVVPVILDIGPVRRTKPVLKTKRTAVRPNQELIAQRVIKHYLDHRKTHVVKREEKRRRDHQQAVDMLRRHAPISRGINAC